MSPGGIARGARRGLPALLVIGTCCFHPLATAGVVHTVTVHDGRLRVDGIPFYVKGIGYNATSIGSDQQDADAAQYDVPRMAQMNANDVVTYIANRFEWGGTEYTGKLDLQDAVSNACDDAGLFTSVGFWSPIYIDYTSGAVRTQWGNFYKEMVNRYQNRSSTLMYVIGNEVLNNLPDDTQRNAYADWVEELVQWTHLNDPNHPVAYADAGSGQLARLASRAPSLDIYGTNWYEFETATVLGAYLDAIESDWPGVAVFLHEYGSDSYNHATGGEDETMQAGRVRTLVQAVYEASADPHFIGGAYFEFTDEWKLVNGSGTQDPGNSYGWQPKSPFDHYADEDFWGIARAVNSGDAENRVLKSAYQALQEMYAIPEPAAAALAAAGAALLALLRRHRRERHAEAARR